MHRTKFTAIHILVNSSTVTSYLPSYIELVTQSPEIRAWGAYNWVPCHSALWHRIPLLSCPCSTDTHYYEVDHRGQVRDVPAAFAIICIDDRTSMVHFLQALAGWHWSSISTCPSWGVNLDFPLVALSLPRGPKYPFAEIHLRGLLSTPTLGLLIFLRIVAKRDHKGAVESST